jgi:hypothetical protein
VTATQLQQIVDAKMLTCRQCDNDAEFELVDDDPYNVVCGVCGWKRTLLDSKVKKALQIIQENNDA